MLELTATAIAIEQLRALKSSSPSLFEMVSVRLQSLRDDPGGRHHGRSFLLDDGSVAHLATLFDVDSSRDLALIWKIEPAVEDRGDRLFVIRVEYLD